MTNLDLVALAVDGPVLPVWKSNFGVPHAIDATSSPPLHLLDGVDNLTHWLISTQILAATSTLGRLGPLPCPDKPSTRPGTSREATQEQRAGSPPLETRRHTRRAASRPPYTNERRTTRPTPPSPVGPAVRGPHRATAPARRMRLTSPIHWTRRASLSPRPAGLIIF